MWVGALAVVLFLLTATLGKPPAVTGSGASAYLPADGYRVRFSNDTGSRSSEWSVGSLLTMVLSGPASAIQWNGIDKVANDAVVARLSTVLSKPAGQPAGRRDDFLLVSPSGLRTGLETVNNSAYRIFVPERLDLPNSVVAGRSWTSDGSVVESSGGADKRAVKYHAEFVATKPTAPDELVRRCLVVTMRQSIAGVAEPPVIRTWCPGLGIIAVTDSQGSWRATTDTASMAPGPATDFNWSDADRLQFSPRIANQVGPSNAFADPMLPPGILPDGTLVAVQRISADTVAVGTDTQLTTIRWRVRAGANGTTAASFSQLTLIANTNRQLVAYDGNGRWLWQSQLRDLAVVPPVRVGDLAVVATLDGSVTAFSLATGIPAWSQRLNAEIRVGLQTSGDQVVAIDQTGTLACFDSTGNQRWSTQLDPSDRFAISSGANPVVVVPQIGSIWTLGISLADGSQLWRAKVLISRKSLVGMDGQVAIRDRFTTIGLDAATGRTRWTWEGPATYDTIGGGHRLFLLAQNRLILLDDQGRQLRDWPVEVHMSENQNAFLSTSAGRFVVFGPIGIEVGVPQ